MHTLAVAPEILNDSTLVATKNRIEQAVDRVMGSLPSPEQLSSEQRRGMIARYTAVLEGNFIYWMTAAYLSVKSEEARPIIIDNLLEEVRDSHPAMLRRFAIAAGALPTKDDALVINDELSKARLFFGKLSGVKTLVAMAFFEGFIQRFMAYLADLAVAQGSTEMEYTDVHGVCDIAHTEGLIQALSSEMVLSPLDPDANMFEGVELLEALMDRVAYGKNSAVAA
jgi:Iron-containing redox enzyme